MLWDERAYPAVFGLTSYFGNFLDRKVIFASSLVYESNAGSINSMLFFRSLVDNEDRVTLWNVKTNVNCIWLIFRKYSPDQKVQK